MPITGRCSPEIETGTSRTADAADRDLLDAAIGHLARSTAGEGAGERRGPIDAERLGVRGAEREKVAAGVDPRLEGAAVDLDRDARELPVGLLEEGRRHGLTSLRPLDAVGLVVPERPHEVPDGQGDCVVDPLEEPVRLGVAVRLEIDEREGGLGVRPRLDVLSRARDDLVQEHLRRDVVAEQVLELGHPAHDLERGVALVHHRREDPARLGEAPRGVRGARSGYPLVLAPAQP